MIIWLIMYVDYEYVCSYTNSFISKHIRMMWHLKLISAISFCYFSFCLHLSTDLAYIKNAEMVGYCIVCVVCVPYYGF